MKNKILIIAFLILASAFTAYAEEMIILNFDQTSKFGPFVFKDDKGSTWSPSSGYSDSEKGFFLGIKYAIEPGGFGGWGIGLKALNASQYNYLTFAIKGEKGGEIVEVGMRDTKGKEKKLLVEDFITVDTSWNTVKIPFKGFTDVDMSTLDNIHFAMSDAAGKGKIFIDDVKLVSDEDDASREQDYQGVAKVLIDGFERTNANDRYYVYEGDDSSLRLTSSRSVKDGDYSLELEYLLATTKSLGTWVAAHLRSGVDILNWVGAREVKLWVYGDASDNILAFNIIDTDNDVWTYEDRGVLNQTQWTLVTMPIAKFREKTGKIKRLDLSKIKTFEIAIISKTGVLSPGTKRSTSRIFVDQLYLLGNNMNPIGATPPNIVAKLRTAIPSNGNVDFSGVAYTEYYNSPTTQSTMFHWGKLAADAKVDKYSVRLEFVASYQEFGYAAYYISTTSNTTTGGGQDMRVNISDLHVSANDPFPGVTKLTVGNIWLDYTPYTFAGTWGYKGLTAEGDWDELNYHFFMIKGRYNNFTTGTRLKTMLSTVNLLGLVEIPLKIIGTGIVVYSEDSARLPSLSNISEYGTLTKTESLRVQKVSQDTVFTLEAKRKFFTDRMQVTYTYGANYFSRIADADYTDPYEPVYNNLLATPINLAGMMSRIKAEIYDIGIKGFSLSGEYRDLDHEFKPKYRNNPNGFDDYETDMRGYNIRASEWYNGFNVSVDYDSIVRTFYKDGYRRRTSLGLGYYGVKGIELSFNKELRRDVNNIRSGRSAFSAWRDEDVIANEFYVRSQLKDNMVLWFKIRHEELISYLWNSRDDADIFNTQFEYYMSSNAKFIAEFKTLRSRWPNDWDNYVKAYFEVTF